MPKTRYANWETLQEKKKKNELKKILNKCYHFYVYS